MNLIRRIYNIDINIHLSLNLILFKQLEEEIVKKILLNSSYLNFF